MLHNKERCELRFSEKFNGQTQGLGATRSNILRLLRSLDLVGWSTHEESGRIDRKAFTRFSTGSTAIFSKRQHVEAERSAVSILIDCSGSMDSCNRIQNAQDVAIQLSRILDKANVSFSVTGFYGGKDFENLRGKGLKDAIRENVTFLPFKTWKENLARASAKLGAMDLCAKRSTPDYSALSLSLEDLSRRDEQRKILFILTDADGYDKSHTKHLQSLADSLNIKIIAIGMGRAEVSAFFKNGSNVTDVRDLASASFNKVLQVLK